MKLLQDAWLKHDVDAASAIEWTLVAVGVLTTFPLALEVFGDEEK